MARAQNQRRLFLELVELLRPHWRRDANQPARLQRWLAAHRAGSRDRRLYRELCYTLWRILPWVENAAPEELIGIVATCATSTPATEDFVQAYRLAALPPTCDPRQLLPDWLPDECPRLLDPAQQAALLARAPLWIRLQTDDAESVRLELIPHGWTATPAEILPDAWRLEGEGDLTQLPTFQAGAFEIQDLGSQLVLAWVEPGVGERWLDACAGAGGKTLQLARAVGPTGQVLAHDVRGEALTELRRRTGRARLNHVQTLASPPAAGRWFDGVLIDAPCSGSGTWRRAPHLKWTTSPADLTRAAERQLRLLHQYAAHVRPGGRLVYVTCSLCRTENDAVIRQFLQADARFRREPLPGLGSVPAGEWGTALLPADVDSDAFFVSAMRRGD